MNYKLILIFIVFIFGFQILSAQNLYSYFYAYGENEINVYWDLFCDYPDELLGCNIYRYQDDPSQAYQLNQELIISENTEFYFLDSYNIVDTALYFYRVDYVFENDTVVNITSHSSFQYIEFNALDSETIEMIAVPKFQGSITVQVFFNMSAVEYLYSTDTFQIEMNPFFLENYTTYISYLFWDEEFNNWGNITTSIHHLKELLLTNLKENNDLCIIITSYPNPLITHTNIKISNVNENEYSIDIFNSNGSLVKSIYKGILKQGEHDFIWDRTNNNNQLIENGMYYAVITNSNHKQTLKLLVM